MNITDLTKYEKARILGARALQISMNAPLLIKIEAEDLEKINYDALKIAEVELTSKGKDLAIELIRHARLLEIFLHNELGVKPELAHRESENINLLFSCETINKICKKYKHPKKCPCGEEILSSSHCGCETEINNSV